MDQTVKLYYLGESPALQTQKPYLISTGFMKSIPQCNWRYEAGPEQVIQDVRGHEADFTLDKHGFAFRQWSPCDVDWEDESQIVATFLPEAKQLLCQALNLGDALKRCEVFDWRLRISDSTQQLTKLDGNRTTKIRPAQAVHTDQSSAGTFDRLQRHLGPEEVEELTAKYRVQIFNIWRPFRGIVQQWPLAIGDARTVSLDDMEELEYVTEEFIRSSYLAKWSERLRFYYLSNMTTQEVAIFKIFDSAYHVTRANDARGTCTCCPHAAFEIPSVTSAPPRESVEVRMFVISEY